jgi:hypothetical protein
MQDKMEKAKREKDRQPSLSPQISEVDQYPTIEFSAVAYALYESEQEITIIVQRTGPIDVDARFRCLHSLVYRFTHALL